MSLVERIMRLLSAMGIFNEVAKDKFQPTTISKACVSRSPFSAAIIHMYVVLTVNGSQLSTMSNCSILAPRI